jgi:hypothetical protein
MELSKIKYILKIKKLKFHKNLIFFNKSLYTLNIIFNLKNFMQTKLIKKLIFKRPK